MTEFTDQETNDQKRTEKPRSFWEDIGLGKARNEPNAPEITDADLEIMRQFCHREASKREGAELLRKLHNYAAWRQRFDTVAEEEYARRREHQTRKDCRTSSRAR